MTEENDVSQQRRVRFFAYAPLVLWIAVILVLGSGPGASAQTSRFIKPLIDFFFPDASPDTFLLVHSFIRKTAHFVEYAILAILAGRALLASPFRKLHRHWIIVSLASVVAVAAADEFNQSFQSARTGSGIDVLLDLSGGLAGVVIFALFLKKRLSDRRDRQPRPSNP
ncbi:MAG: VanZ family protein [Pyrinomonadaceae bacterium]